MNKDELPPILEAKLSDFRRRVWIVKLAEGLLAACFGIALSYVLVFVLDRFMETPAWLRGVLLASGAAVLGFGVPLKWHRWVWRQRRLEDAARLLRRRFPRLGDQLLGIVELARKDSVSGRSETLVQAAMAQAAEAVKDQDFTKAVPHARHRAWAWAAGGAVALALAAFITVSDAARNALARWLMPWREVDRYTFARVDQLPKNLVVPYAEPFSLPVKLSNDTKWSPDNGTGRIKGQPEVNVSLQNGSYPLAFPPQKNDVPMKISLGDVRKTLQVEPRTRPELATLTARLRLPAYLKYKTEPGIEVRGGSISVLKGSEVAFVASASRDLADAEMDGARQKVEGDKLLTNYSAVENSGERRFNWRDTLGLSPREPLVLKVQAVEDEAPRIIARRETQETVVMDSEVLSFDLSVADDFGVLRAGLEWVGEKKSDADEKPMRGEKVAVAGEPEKRQMDARATFCATRESVAPQTLQVRAWAEDYLPGRKRAYSQSFILHILNKQDHALWLTEQFAKWLQVARESYEREQQLHQTNKELRELSAADLDRPENRRKVMQQAASERANADRLDNLTQLGKSLVEQATHNPEFEAKRLESWASMLKDLRNIAAQRMPSVADLLKQSSNAATKSMASSNPGKPAPGDQKPQPSTSQNSSGKPSPGEQKPQQSPSQNSSGKPPEGGEQKPGDSKPSAPQVTSGEQNPSSDPPKPSDPNAEKKPAVPSIADNEKGFFKPEDKKPEDTAKPPSSSGGKLGLPQTTLGAAPSEKKPEDESPPESPAQDKMQKAVAEQRDLLAEFAKVADQLSELMASLEASTFVKRLKFASRSQMTVASDLNSKTLSAFGLERKDVNPEPAAHVDAIAGREKDQSEVVRVIQSDLEAYYQRRQDERFKNIIEQMKKSEIVGALLRTGDQTGVNLSGRSIASSEFWADTLDRWAEELVSASESSKSSPGSGESASLPPEIILMVMQALRDEMKLRDETRELENARPALTRIEYQDKAQPLARTQERIAILTQSASDAILMLPEGAEKFKDELKLLGAVRLVMDEAGGILEKPDTGPEAIAAETEAIELLLQAKRQSKGGGGGGGGGSPGGGGGSATAGGTSLAELGPGADSAERATSRPVGQQTGRAGREFPEEFKSGLDAYFNKLEVQGGAKP